HPCRGVDRPVAPDRARDGARRVWRAGGLGAGDRPPGRRAGPGRSRVGQRYRARVPARCHARCAHRARRRGVARRQTVVRHRGRRRPRRRVDRRKRGEMPKRIAWNRRLNAKLGGATLVLLVVSVALISANIYMLQDIKEDAAQVRQVGRGREYAYEYLYWAHRLFAETGAARDEVASSIQRVIADTDDRLRAQLSGDAASGIA